MKWLVLFIAWAMCAEVAVAQQMSPTSLRLSKAFASDATGQTYRLRYAVALHDYCESVAAKVPINTRAETTWVEKETVDSILDPGPSFSRLHRLETSIEYSRYVLRITLEKCAEILKSIPAKSGLEEAVLWSDLALQLSSVDDFPKSGEDLRIGDWLF